MPRKTQRRHRGGDASWQRILDAAMSIAAERGYAGTSIGLITARTGLPASSVYWHFKDKDDLLDKALEHSYLAWRATTPPWPDDIEAGDRPARIRQRMQYAAAGLVASPGFWRLGLMLALEQREAEPAARRRFLEVRHDTQAGIADWWRHFLPAEATTRDASLPMRLARYQVAVVDGLYVGLQAGRDWDREVLIDMLAAGLDAFAARERGGHRVTTAEPSEPRRSRPQPPDSRKLILDAAARIAAESGYEATTISKITARSGLPVSSVYWYFKGKDELLAEVVRHSFDEWRARQPALFPLAGGVPLTEGLAAILATSVRSLPAAPDFMRIGHLLTLEKRETEPAARTLFLRIRDSVERNLADWFAHELEPDLLTRRPRLPHHLAQLVIAATDGLFLAHQIHEVWDPDEFVALIVDIVRTAIAATGRAGARATSPAGDWRG